MLVFACISPHPPIILPTVGSPADRAKVKKTITALEKLGQELSKIQIDQLIISSPHPDWGFEVPLYFLKTKTKNIKTYLTSLESPQHHYELGKKIARGLPTGRQVWIASGDMSHKLKTDGPYGFDPAGPKFDAEFIRLLKKKDIQGILNLDPELVEQAGECGLRSFCMLLGALENTNWQPKVLSYEGPFGVGYLVAQLK